MGEGALWVLVVLGLAMIVGAIRAIWRGPTLDPQRAWRRAMQALGRASRRPRP